MVGTPRAGKPGGSTKHTIPIGVVCFSFTPQWPPKSFRVYTDVKAYSRRFLGGVLMEISSDLLRAILAAVLALVSAIEKLIELVHAGG